MEHRIHGVFEGGGIRGVALAGVAAEARRVFDRARSAAAAQLTEHLSPL